MKSWKKPTNELIDRAYGMMKKQFDHEYFFTRLKNPLWIQPLVERGCFQSPPKMRKLPGGYIQTPVWPELRYLKNVTDEVPAEVVDVVLGLPIVDNPRVYNDILDIALQLQGEKSIKLTPKILECIGLEYHLRPYQFANVLAYWTAENQTAAALKLAKALVEFVPDPQDKTKRKRRREESEDLDALLATLADTQLDPSPRFNSMEYRRILSEGVRPLVAKEPYKVAFVLIDATANMMHLRTHQEDIGKDFDNSELWFQRLTESEGDYKDTKNALIHTLTFACQQVYEKRPDSVEDLDNALRAQPWRIFKRMRQHLFAQYPTETTKAWIQGLIREYKNYHRWEYSYELQQMIRSACKHFGTALLTKDELKGIFDCICNGPSKDGLTKEEFRQHQRRFHRKQFRPFAPVLFGTYKTYFQELEAETKGDISDDDYPPFKTKVRRVSARSPRSPENLVSLKDEEILTFINEWEDKAPFFEGNTVIQVNIQGLSKAFQDVFREGIIPAPERHRFWMENRGRIVKTDFVESMINAMQQCVEANNFDNLDEWLTFSEWVLSHPDDSEDVIYDRHAGESRDKPNWSNSRWAMGDFIGSCFRTDVNPPVSARGQLARLLEMFCTQFDWRLDRHSTKKEPVDAYMNAPRCRALEALVNFGLWLQRNDRGNDVSEVIAILEKRLAPTAKYPLTLPEYAILGQNYNRLLHLNEAWATEHKSDFFPQDEFPKWLAAFDRFLGFNSLSKQTFERFQGDFNFALEHLSDIKKQDRPDDKLIDMIGQHLFVYYLRGLYPLRGEESLLERYYQASDDDREQWASLFDYVGHRLRNVTKQLDINEKKKIICFFEWRFEVREPVELQQFTTWLKAECLDARWRLNAYSEILDITKSEDMSIHMEVKALCDMLPDHTEKVVECFHKLTKDIGDKNLSIFTEEATAILQVGFGSSDESVRQNATQACENLLHLGRFDLLELKD